MVRKSAGAMPSVSAAGKPTEATGVPQPNMGHKGGLLPGIVGGIPRKTHTKMVDGLIPTACGHKMGSNGVHAVPKSATNFGTQQFGSTAYADGKIGK